MSLVSQYEMLENIHRKYCGGVEATVGVDLGTLSAVGVTDAVDIADAHEASVWMTASGVGTNVVMRVECSGDTEPASLAATTISFVHNASSVDNIEDSAGGFAGAGFASGQQITVTGSTSNDGTYTITDVNASTLFLSASDTLTDEAAGDAVTVEHAEDDWSNADELERDITITTDGIRSFVYPFGASTARLRVRFVSSSGGAPSVAVKVRSR